MSAQPKTLSNGTLALKFMQNAQRMRNEAQVELEQAKVKDDAEWEVAQEVREAWGLGTSKQSQTAIIYEQSYLPFLFAQDEGDTSSTTSVAALKVRGRRSFKKNREETEFGEEEKAMSNPSDMDKIKIPEEYPKGARPIALSGRASNTMKGRSEDKQKKKYGHDKGKPSMPILQMISDEKGVGVDMKTARKSSGDDSSPVGFLRPAGVDSPLVKTEVGSEIKVDSLEARRNKRVHEGRGKEGGEQREKRKKKQSSTD